VIEPLVLLRGRTRALLDRRPEQHKELLTRDIVDAVAEGRSGGALKEQSADMIEGVLALEERVVSEVMTPRTELTSVAIDATLDEAVALALRDSHSKIPVFEKNRDQIKGMFHVRDALTHFGDGRHREVTVGEVMRPALFVPATKKVAQLLRELQAARQSVAVVLDEYGGTAGIITVEDIVEEIVGELSEQHDREPTVPFLRLAGHPRDAGELISFDPRLRVAEFNEKAGANLPESDEYDTVGGFVLKHLDRIPETGEMFTTGGLEFRVTRVEGRRIARLHCRTVAPTRPASS
jgi:CBS domain containing-hemolysin-like protein